MKRVTQELGGKSPNLILPDANLESAVPLGVAAAFRNVGQSCSAPTRMIVPSQHLAQVEQLACSAASQLVVGDPGNERTTHGPVANQAQFEDLEALRLAWRERYGAPPSLRSVPIMRMLLAWRIQSDALGGLDDHTRKLIARKTATQREGRHLGIGARLTRQWRGRNIEVVVEENGFHWEGRVFPSLSAAATAIAGSRWNGPRFFGLRPAP